MFCCLFLDNRHRVIAFDEVFRGTIDGASVHPRDVVKLALTRNAAAVILAHNHPSGIAEPSQADEVITGRLRDALALVDIRVLDHIVVGMASACRSPSGGCSDLPRRGRTGIKRGSFFGSCPRPALQSQDPAIMSKVCQVTGKKPMSGNTVSHANNRKRRRFLPNLHTQRFWLETEKRWVSLRVSGNGMRTIDKKGIEVVVNELRAQGVKV